MFSLLGLSLQQPSNSHQEIIIKFSDAKRITLETQNNTIAIVKKQLQKIFIHLQKTIVKKINSSSKNSCKK